MIYVSTACVKNRTIAESVRQLAQGGYQYLELSGGTQYYPDFANDLRQLQEAFGLHYMLHNYFPPPPKPFVLNLASMNQDIFDMSVEHCKRAIDLSIELGSRRFAIHAGFFIDIHVGEIGRNLSKNRIYDTKTALEQFCHAYENLVHLAGSDLRLYIENNVLSAANYQTYGHQNPLMFTDRESYLQLSSQLDFNYLLDVAHLKVSCQTLGFNFQDELDFFIDNSDYLHISDNNGLADTNSLFQLDSDLAKCLERYNLQSKTVTLEIYDTLLNINQSYESIRKLMYDE